MWKPIWDLQTSCEKTQVILFSFPPLIFYQFIYVQFCFQNLILQRSQPNSYGSEEASTFDLEEFLDHGNQFKDFVREYERQYDSDSEIERRFDIFRNNLKTIDYYTKHEQGTATYGVNRFADMTDSEFNHGLSSLDWEQIENLKSTFETYSFNSSNSYGLAESINYKDKGKVLPKVQDQHLCGSCWAHSAVACLESAYAIKHNELIELSKQRKWKSSEWK